MGEQEKHSPDIVSHFNNACPIDQIPNHLVIVLNNGRHWDPSIQFLMDALGSSNAAEYAEKDEKKQKDLECQTFKALVLDNANSICAPLDKDLSFDSIPDYDYGDTFHKNPLSWDNLLGQQYYNGYYNEYHDGYYDDGTSCRVDLSKVGPDPLKYDVNPVTHEVRELTTDEQINAQIMHDSAATVAKVNDLNMVSNIVKDVTQQPPISTGGPATDFSNASAEITTPTAPAPIVQQLAPAPAPVTPS